MSVHAWNNEEKLLLGHWRAAFAVQCWTSWVRIKPVQCDDKMAFKPFLAQSQKEKHMDLWAIPTAASLEVAQMWLRMFQGSEVVQHLISSAAQGMSDQPR